MGNIPSAADARASFMTTMAGEVYQPRRDPLTGLPLNDLRDERDATRILPKERAYAPSIGEVPDQGLFDVNAVGSDSVNDTRRQLKAKFISARDRLVGKQLTTIAKYEDVYEFTRKFLDYSSKELEAKGSEGDHFRQLKEHLKALERQMRDDEMDPNKSMLEDFKEAIGNHLVLELDPYDMNARKDTIHEIVLCCDVQYQTAEDMLRTALRHRAEVFAHNLIPTIHDPESEQAAIAAVRAECNCTWLMARDLIAQAISGKFADLETKMSARDYSCESIAMNKQRLAKYEVLMEWWKVRREGAEKEDEENEKSACLPDTSQLTPEAMQQSFMESYQNSTIDKVFPVVQELKMLTKSYDEIESKWSVYLSLSVANEVGAEGRSYQGKGQRQRQQAKILRNDVRAELFEALTDVLDPVFEDNKEDQKDIELLLKNLEEVEIETDNYVHRLETNLKVISIEEDNQVDSMLLQQSQMTQIANRLDSVNAELSANLGRMQQMTGNAMAIYRLVVAVAFGIAVIGGAFVLQKMP